MGALVERVPLGGDLVGACGRRTDHLYDFLPPADPWQPVGQAAQLGGASLIVLATVLPLLPWALAGRRPGPFSALAVALSTLGTAAVGVATLRSGLAGDVVSPPYGALSVGLWVWILPVLLVRLAVAAHGWARACAVVLFLGTPVVAMMSYAIGDWDARPWWEGMAAGLMVMAAGCLLVAAVRRPEPAAVAEPFARVAM